MAETNIKKQQMEYIGIAILVLVAFFIGINKLKKENTVDDEVFSRTEFNKKWKEVEILEAERPHEEKGIIYMVELERLPFKSPFEEEIDLGIDEKEKIVLPQMLFQGMIWRSVRPQAIINNTVYDINDKIETEQGKVEVKNITKEGIYLRFKRKDFIVKPK